MPTQGLARSVLGESRHARAVIQHYLPPTWRPLQSITIGVSGRAPRSRATHSADTFAADETSGGPAAFIAQD